MKTEMISARSIINEYLGATGHEGELDEQFLLKCINDGTDMISTNNQLVHRVAILDVRDYKAKLPEHFRYVIQAAGREGPDKCILKEQISQMKQRIAGSECELEINLVCPRCHKETCACDDVNVVEVDADRIWKNAHPEYAAAYAKSFYSYGNNTGRGYTSMYSDDFLLMKYKSGSFWNARYHINGCLNLRMECGLEYNVEPPMMIVNFKHGEVLLGYMSKQVDSDGYLMVPNDPQVIQAIVYFTQERAAFRKYSQTNSKADRMFWMDMVQMREMHIGRAKNRMRNWDEDQMWNFLQNHWRKYVPYRKWDLHNNRNMPDQYMFPDETYNIGNKY